mgnify:CR=1 FL=1
MNYPAYRVVRRFRVPVWVGTVTKGPRLVSGKHEIRPNVRLEAILLKKSLAVSGGSGLVRSLMRLSPSGGLLEGVGWHQLCHFTQVLGGCCEKELISGAIWAS